MGLLWKNNGRNVCRCVGRRIRRWGGLLAGCLAVFGAAEAAALEVVLPPDPSVAERHVAEFLREQLAGDTRLDGVCIELATDESMSPEAWSMAGDGATVTLRGGRYGLIHAAAHYLEDICGKVWFAPSEVVQLDAGPVADFAERSGDFAFPGREVFATWAEYDGGLYAAMRGLSSCGATGIAPRYNGRKIFGPPNFVHTFDLYIPAAQYFAKHPEWFAELDGKRCGESSQLCLSNKALRQEVIARLREFIAMGKKNADDDGMEPPTVYSISQNDNQQYCRCAE